MVEEPKPVEIDGVKSEKWKIYLIKEK